MCKPACLSARLSSVEERRDDGERLLGQPLTARPLAEPRRCADSSDPPAALPACEPPPLRVRTVVLSGAAPAAAQLLQQHDPS